MQYSNLSMYDLSVSLSSFFGNVSLQMAWPKYIGKLLLLKIRDRYYLMIYRDGTRVIPFKPPTLLRKIAI